jgi:energy-converting hydrogenase Eha subunit H
VNGSSTAKALTITAGGEISLSPADGTNPGIMTTGTQTLAGAKTFASLTSSGNSSVGGNLIVTGSQTNSALTASKVIFTDASKVLTSTGTVGVEQGGTGASTLTSAALLVGAGTSAVTAISPGTDGQVLISRSGVWGAENASPAVTLGNVNGSSTAKALTITAGGEISLSPADATNPGIMTTGTQTLAGAKTFASLTSSGNMSVGGNLELTGSQTNSALTASKVIFTDASKVLTSTGTVGVAQGGTGASTLTTGALLIGNGTGAVTSLAPSTAGYVLKVVGSTWTISAPDTDESDQFIANTNQLTFTLTQTPVSNSKVRMFINGVRTDKTAYTLATNVITYIPANNSSFTLVAGDRIQFDYAY